jgi:hypothetical protein
LPKRQPAGKTIPEETRIMSKPAKTQAELVAMARAELKVHADCPDGIVISIIRDGESWEFRARADEATVAKPGYPECVAMLVQIGDHLSKQYDVEG